MRALWTPKPVPVPPYLRVMAPTPTEFTWWFKDWFWSSVHYALLFLSFRCLFLEKFYQLAFLFLVNSFKGFVIKGLINLIARWSLCPICFWGVCVCVCVCVCLNSAHLLVHSFVGQKSDMAWDSLLRASQGCNQDTDHIKFPSEGSGEKHLSTSFLTIGKIQFLFTISMLSCSELLNITCIPCYVVPSLFKPVMVCQSVLSYALNLWHLLQPLAK